MIRIEEYLTAGAFGQWWFAALDPQAATIMTVALGQLGDGNISNVKPIGEGAELRIEHGLSCCIYFGGDGKVYCAGRGRRNEMALTKSFRKTVQARAACDPKFRKALFQEAVRTLLQGDTETGRAAMRAYINATIGFERLGEALGRSPKSLMRMFGPSGNPTADNLLGVIGVLQAETGIHLEVRAVADAA